MNKSPLKLKKYLKSEEMATLLKYKKPSNAFFGDGEWNRRLICS